MNDIQPRAAQREPRTSFRFASACLMAAVSLGTFFSGCATKEASEEVPTVTVQVGAAEKEAIKKEVKAEAILYPRDQAALVPKVSAPVAKFFVDRGSQVHAGEVLAELENRDLASAYADNRSEPAASGDRLSKHAAEGAAGFEGG